MCPFQNVIDRQDYFDFYLDGNYRLKDKILGLKTLGIQPDKVHCQEHMSSG
jgi:hypothetical protein